MSCMDATTTLDEPTAQSEGRVREAGRVLAAVVLIGFIVQLNSERAYWDYSLSWFGPNLPEMLGTAAFYGFAAASALWMLGRVSFRGIHQVVLMGALFAMTVEGVIVAVLHEGGPFDPFFPAMFTGWHGVLSFVGLFYLVRRWLVAGRRRTLAVASAIYGAIWGLWAIGSRLPDSDGAIGELGVVVAVSSAEFAAMAIGVTVSLALAHVALDRVWPSGWRPGRLSGWPILGITGLLALAWGLAIPYAPLRWAVLVSIPLWALARSNRGPAGPNLFRSLSGRIDARDLVALAPIPLVASAIYAAAGELAIPESTLEVIRFSHVMGQVLLGAGALVWAVRRSRRPVPEPSAT